MAEPEEDTVSRSEYEQAVARAERAEAILDTRRRAVEVGLPPELAAHCARPMSDEELVAFRDRLRDYVAERVEQRLQEDRPDRRNGGRFLVQNVAGIEPDWLRERLQERQSERTG
jgi:hypothetical protein